MAENKNEVQGATLAVRLESCLKMEPTDLQKYDQDAPITLLARKRAPAPKPKKPKERKTPKKTKQ
jgi:hypothetical protein